jgi:hypothetical protein
MASSEWPSPRRMRRKAGDSLFTIRHSLSATFLHSSIPQGDLLHRTNTTISGVPSLGVSSLDLGRRQPPRGPFFCARSAQRVGSGE